VGKIGFSANEQRELNLPTNSTQANPRRFEPTGISRKVG
jgi:hypothetical protein